MLGVRLEEDGLDGEEVAKERRKSRKTGGAGEVDKANDARGSNDAERTGFASEAVMRAKREKSMMGP